MGDADEPPAEPHLRPLGAPTDPLRPTGRVESEGLPRMSPPVESPAPKRRNAADVWIGVGFAAVLFAFQWLALLPPQFIVSNRQVSPVLATFVGFLPLALLVAIHIWAIAAKRPKILVGFWTAIGVAALIFIVSCFALIYSLGY